MKYCTKCGKALDDNVKFCTNCGEPMPTSAPQPAPQSTPQPNPQATQPVAPPPVDQQVSKPVQPEPLVDNSGNGGKKTVIILAVALACVVVICAVVLVIFATRDSGYSSETEVTTAVETTLVSNVADVGRYRSLMKRFNDAKLKAAKRGVSVKKAKNAAKEALESYKEAIDDRDASLMSDYGDEAEKYVSKLEKAANKAKKKTTVAQAPRVQSQYNVPESQKTNYRVAPTSSVGEYYFDDILDDDADRYAATTLAINEYYARHGCKFVTPALQEYFEHQKWYKNQGKSTSSVSLSGTEAHNATRLQKDRQWYKKNMAGASGQASDFSYSDFVRVAKMVN